MQISIKGGELMKKNMKRLMIAVLALCLIALSACQSPASSNGAKDGAKSNEAVKVVCENGVMLGNSTDGVTSFKGVPFAKPPVNELRWKAPQAPDPSDREIECYDFGYVALQYEWPSEPASYSPKSEDCLTLNIWKNEGIVGNGEKKPVMVFFHGGAYGWGGTTDPVYNGQNFAKAHDDVIIVTCNYRLGLMSFADFSKVEGGEEYTDINLGIRDHIAALQWIQKNISGFGGDPDNVTIFGESAGAWSTTALMISPKARGLFKRAIAQSGQVALRSREDAQQYAEFIMQSSDAKNMKELLAISGEEWIKLDAEKKIADECCYAIADGDIIPKDFNKAIEDAAKSGIKLIIGSNADEWNYFQEDSDGKTTQEKFKSWVDDMDDMIAEARDMTDQAGKSAMDELLRYEESIVPEEYAGDEKVKSALAKSGVVSELWRYEILDFADRFANAGGETYVYHWKVPSTRDDMYKSAVHAVELPYIFNNTESDQYAGKVDPDVAVKAQEAWISFAKTGAPTVEDADWKKYSTAQRDTMVIEKDQWSCVSDPSKTPRELLWKAFKDEPYHVW